MGPSIATEILLHSDLKKNFRLIHQETKLNRNLDNIGKMSAGKLLLLAQRYIGFLLKIVWYRPQLVSIPISQSWSGFTKDAVFIRLASIFKRKIVIHLRGSNFLTFYNELPEAKQQSIRATLDKCYGAIVLGEKLRYIFEPFFPSDKIFVVPNGANYLLPSQNNSITGEFRMSSVKQIQQIDSSTNQQFNLIYLGNLQPSKGILDVIEAFVLLSRYAFNSSNKQFNSLTNIQLHIVGKWRDADTKKEVQTILTKAGFVEDSGNLRVQQFNNSTNKQISFHSVLSGAPKLELLSQCDLMIFPPREPEGHPWVIVEAMAAGLPIIATDQGAITESVHDDVNGFIIEKQNPGAITEKVKLLIENHALRQKMGQESRRLYEANFTEERMVERLTNVFNTCLKLNE